MDTLLLLRRQLCLLIFLLPRMTLLINPQGQPKYNRILQLVFVFCPKKYCIEVLYVNIKGSQTIQADQDSKQWSLIFQNVWKPLHDNPTRLCVSFVYYCSRVLIPRISYVNDSLFCILWTIRAQNQLRCWSYTRGVWVSWVGIHKSSFIFHLHSNSVSSIMHIYECFRPEKTDNTVTLKYDRSTV